MLFGVHGHLWLGFTCLTLRCQYHHVRLIATKSPLTTTPRILMWRLQMEELTSFRPMLIYGVDASVHTLENLYGIRIDYYVRRFFFPQASRPVGRD